MEYFHKLKEKKRTNMCTAEIVGSLTFWVILSRGVFKEIYREKGNNQIYYHRMEAELASQIRPHAK